MYPEGPEMDDILVATAARPQAVDSDERLGERQQQMPIPSQRGRGERCRGHQSGRKSPRRRELAPKGCKNPQIICADALKTNASETGGDGWCQADLGISLKGVESSLRG